MKHSASALSAIFTAAIAACVFTAPANALSLKDCSTKYQAAKAGGTLGSQSWNDFQRLQCASDAAPAAAATTSEATSGASSASSPSPTAKPAMTSAASPAQAAAQTTAKAAVKTVGNLVFPKAIAAAYSSESVGKARMHTCLDQYKANKATNANGGLEWIQKGGGYYSECNKQLKG